MPYCRIRCTITEMRADCLYLAGKGVVNAVDCNLPIVCTLRKRAVSEFHTYKGRHRGNETSSRESVFFA